jgi:membrane associated rhomboid family serine protease
MLILPLPPRPDWKKPPIVTLAIMIICAAMFIWQQGDVVKADAAVHYYAQSSLPGVELPAFQAYQRAHGKIDADFGETMLHFQRLRIDEQFRLLQKMQIEPGFMADLENDRLITPEQTEYQQWRQDRNDFDRQWSGLVTFRLSLNGAAPTAKTLISHMFLHANLEHLLGNMAVFFVVAYTVESALGGWLFLLLFLLGGFGSTAVDLYRAHPGLDLGASGAISAVMASYVVLFGRQRVRFFYFLLVFINTARWPALAILPVWVGNELFQYLTAPTDNHVNFLAHFGGFLAGAALTAIYRGVRGGRTADTVERGRELDAQAEIRRQAEQLLQAGQFERATAQYARLVATSPLQLADMLAYFRCAKLAPAQLYPAIDALLTLAGMGEVVPGDAVADAVRELWRRRLPTPKLKVSQWLMVARRIIDAGQFDVAKPLVTRLARQHVTGVPALLLRLVTALHKAGQTDEAAPFERLLTELHSDSDEARYLAQRRTLLGRS